MRVASDEPESEFSTSALDDYLRVGGENATLERLDDIEFLQYRLALSYDTIMYEDEQSGEVYESTVIYRSAEYYKHASYDEAIVVVDTLPSEIELSSIDLTGGLLTFA